MLIGYAMPAVTAVALSAGTWLTTDAGTACFDEKPARKSRFSWPAGKSTITDYVTVTATFANASTLRVFAALGLSLPAGTRVVFVGHAGAALGSITDQRTVTMPDGSVGVFGIGDESLTTHASAGFRIYNDANGSPWANEGDPVDIGELVAMPGVDIPIEPGWELGVQGVMPERHRTRSGALNTATTGFYSSMRFTTQATYVDYVRRGALANQMDWHSLRRAMQNDSRIAVVPRFNSPSEVNSTALYGVAANVGSILHLGGDYYQWVWGFEEVPAR